MEYIFSRTLEDTHYLYCKDKNFNIYILTLPAHSILFYNYYRILDNKCSKKENFYLYYSKYRQALEKKSLIRQMSLEELEVVCFSLLINKETDKLNLLQSELRKIKINRLEEAHTI